MKKLLLLTPCLALVAACGGGAANNAGGAANGSANTANGSAAATGTSETADAGDAGSTGAGSGATLRPGQWEMTAQLVDIEIPGAPPAAAEQMRAQMGREQKQTQCLTEAEVTNIAERMANSNAQGANCNFSRRTFSGGTIDVAGTCQSPQGNVEMAMTGNFTPETMQMNMDMNLSGGPQNMRMKMTTSGRRIGDCPA